MRILHFATILLLASCGEAPAGTDNQSGLAAPAVAPGEADRSRAGQAAPATSFEDPDGQPATLADFRGKPVLLNLWATWCAPCVKEMPTLDALAQREGEKLQVLTVSADLEGRDKVEAFLAARRLRALEAWLDPEMALMTDLGVGTLPATILYDAQGREVWRVIGAEDWTGEEARALIAEAK
jgi:thiol-disulfide isomerase/thioredoxin